MGGWSPVTTASKPKKSSSKSGSKRSKSRSRDIESQRSRKPKEIVLENRHEVTKYKYSWFALSVLAFLLCATLTYLVIVQVIESNKGGEASPTQQQAAQTSANQQAMLR